MTDKRYMDYPFHVDNLGRVAETDDDDHIKDLIYQILFTNPGERVNRPDFGCGLLRVVFAAVNDATLTATQFMVQGALQRYLGDVILVDMVRVRTEDERCYVEVSYVRRNDNRVYEEVFSSSSSIESYVEEG